MSPIRQAASENGALATASGTRPVITLLTDFGLEDHFVGVMKGVILSIYPEVAVVDITHGISSHDIVEAALVLKATYSFFPQGTIHVVIVDPGVGSCRRPLLVRGNKYFFLAPDNGVLSQVYACEEPLEIYHVMAEEYFLKPVSNTFHGRDIFSPVAAWLSRGLEPSVFGKQINDPVKVDLPLVRKIAANRLTGRILRADKFGNLITNVSAQDVSALGQAPLALVIKIGDRQITRLCQSYTEGNPGELFVIWGSSGWLEISASQASAERLLQATKGQEFDVELG